MVSEISSETLFTPFSLQNITLKNRIVMAPLTRSRATEKRIPNSLMGEYYEQRASAGLIISEATVISPQGIGWVNTPGIYTQEQSLAWKEIVSRLHSKGTPIFMQLWHCGRASHSDFQLEGKLPVAPSAIALNGEEIHTPQGKKPREVPHALTTEEVEQVVLDYQTAAKLAKEAGFDGLEIHGANGYLIDEFLQSKTNQRTDKYGGSIEKRFTFLREVLEAILTVWESDRVGVRLSPNGSYNDMGSPDYRETFLYVAEKLNNYDLAYLHVVDGLEFGFHNLGEPMTLSEFREVYQGALMGNCGYTKETAEAAIREGKADLIAFGRPYISNPDLVERFANGWELNPMADMSTWYSFDKEGYTDFPFYEKNQ